MSTGIYFVVLTENTRENSGFNGTKHDIHWSNWRIELEAWIQRMIYFFIQRLIFDVFSPQNSMRGVNLWADVDFFPHGENF